MASQKEIVWTPLALQELVAVCDFIASDSEVYAAHFAQRVVGSVEHLPNFPFAGRIVPEIGRADVREVFVGSYRIVYRVRRNKIEILAVRHGARRFKPPKLR